MLLCQLGGQADAVSLNTALAAYGAGEWSRCLVCQTARPWLQTDCSKKCVYVNEVDDQVRKHNMFRTLLIVYMVNQWWIRTFLDEIADCSDNPEVSQFHRMVRHKSHPSCRSLALVDQSEFAADSYTLSALVDACAKEPGKEILVEIPMGIQWSFNIFVHYFSCLCCDECSGFTTNSDYDMPQVKSRSAARHTLFLVAKASRWEAALLEGPWDTVAANRLLDACAEVGVSKKLRKLSC